MTLIDDVELEFEIDQASLEQAVSERLAHALNGYRNRKDLAGGFPNGEEPLLKGRIFKASMLTIETNLAMRKYPLTCTFCGDFSEHEGHLLSRTAFGSNLQELIGTVPTCVDCNIDISNFPEPDIRARCEFAISKMEHRHAALLALIGSEPQSSAENLAGGSHFLRNDVATLLVRLNVLQAGGFLSLPTETRDRIVCNGVGALTNH